MRLNLREIINIPGGRVDFDYMPDFGDISFEQLSEFILPVKSQGSVNNIAGMLELSAEINADVKCVCARCLREFQTEVNIPVKATIVESAQDEDDPDLFFLDGDFVDLDEIIVTAFVLNIEQRFLCSEDCKGLCEKCGTDLNKGPCKCKAEIDPRLAVLGQLLENE